MKRFAYYWNPSSQQSSPTLSLLHACISRRSLRRGRRLYLHFLESKHHKELLKNPSLDSKFITLFSAFGRLDDAFRAFRQGIEEIGCVGESVYVAMAIGFSKSGNFNEALLVYCEMLSKGIEPGNFAFSVALKACSGLLDSGFGKSVHAQVRKAVGEPDQVVNNALLKFYAECGTFEEVSQLFDDMPDRNVATWNALIVGFVRKHQVSEGFETFRRMQKEGVGFSWVSLTTILAACARLTSLYIGKEVYAQLLKSEECSDVLAMNALLGLYAKCGAMENCRKVFDRMTSKDLMSCNTLINGYAINGWIQEAISAFEDMAEARYVVD